MDFKDYYKILDISKTATTAEVKKAYRKLAVKYHPDKNPNDKSAEAKFKEVNEANEILKDDKKRKEYDIIFTDYQNYQKSGGKQGFDNYSQGKQSQNNAQYGNSANSSQQFNDDRFADFFSSMFGAQDQRANRSQETFKAQDFTAVLELTLAEAYTGASKLIQLETEKLAMKIKPGVVTGQILRLKGKGAKATNSANNGDLLITVDVKEDKNFTLKEHDLYCTITVDLYTAVLGGKVEITTLKGKTNITILTATPNGTILRLKKMGMPIYNKSDEFGDLYATVSIKIPVNLSPKEITLFNQLATIQNEK